jgi:hypothetical protein
MRYARQRERSYHRHRRRTRRCGTRAADFLVQGLPTQVEPDAAEMAQRYGAETTVPDWRERLVCSRCGSREVDMVVTGTERR